MTIASQPAPATERLDDLDRRSQVVADREAIFRLLVNLQTAMDERDLVAYGRFFAEDGEWCANSGRATGPEAITELLGPYCRDWESQEERNWHSLADVVIDVNGDHGVARGLWRIDFRGEDGLPVTRGLGNFTSLVRRTADGWRLKRHASYSLLRYTPPHHQLVTLTDERDWLSRGTQAATPGDDARRLQAIERRIAEAEDRDAIEHLFIEVQNAMDRREMVRYGQFYTEDGEWCAVNGRAIGPAGITEHLIPYCQPWESAASRTYHSIADVVIDLDGDAATGSAQWQHFHPGNDGKPLAKAFGRFEAIAHRTGEGWLLRRRASYLNIPYIEPHFQLVAVPEIEAEAKARAARSASTAASGGAQPDLSDLEARLGRLEDRAAIHRVFVELIEATDNRDPVAYGQCFTEDGEWAGASGTAHGREAITAYMAAYMTPWPSEELRTYHAMSDLTIDLDGDTATARSQYRFYRPDEEGRPDMTQFCHYDAEMERGEAGWLFKRRASVMDIPLAPARTS